MFTEFLLTSITYTFIRYESKFFQNASNIRFYFCKQKKDGDEEKFEKSNKDLEKIPYKNSFSQLIAAFLKIYHISLKITTFDQ